MKNIKNSTKGRRRLEKGVETLFFICGVMAVGFVLCISVYLVISGIPAIKQIGFKEFFFGKVWRSTATLKQPAYGILPFVLTSVYGTLAASLLGVPIGVLTAVYMAKIAPKKISGAMKTAVQLLAGIPSVVYGLVGMIVLVPWVQRTFKLSSGATFFAAIIVLAIMILPSIINVSHGALMAVPQEYEEASLSLGATYMETCFKVSVPAAKSGIAAAVVLGVGRAIGEAMAVIMVSGNVANMPGLFESVRFMTTAITSEMSYAAVGSLQRQALFSIALVLFVFIMLINVFLNVVVKKRGGKK
jgi:phosphate transport system permease protein